MEVKPTYLPSVPRIFEKLYSKAQEMMPQQLIDAVRQVGLPIAEAKARGEEPPAEPLEKGTTPRPRAPRGGGPAGGGRPARCGRGGPRPPPAPGRAARSSRSPSSSRPCSAAACA